MPDFYKTISKVSEGLFKDKGSKFIAYAFPVKSEKDIKEILANLKKQFHDARHHCYAWALGNDGESIRANDDGEPSGTAGKPILGQIHSFELTNVLIVVIRYFGGTLLGAGGLINAYRSAARDALQNASIRKEFLKAVYEIRFPYTEMNNVMKILKEMDVEQFDKEFEMECKMKTRIKQKEMNRLRMAFKPFPDISLKLLSEE